MRNLCMWQVCSKKGFFKSQEKYCVCYSHYEDSKLGQFFTCLYSLVVNNIDSHGKIKWTKDLSKVASPENKPVNITFLGLVNLVSVGLANGELFTLSSSGADCELVGVCDKGLLVNKFSLHFQ